mgnify:CR=1 FL=1
MPAWVIPYVDQPLPFWAGIRDRFGPAIAGAFEVYREKVSPDLPAAPTFFRDAVNEILGGGSVVL